MHASVKRIFATSFGWLAALALGILVAFTPSPAWAEQTGRCARAAVPWPVTLPDGSVHDAGTLKLCLQQMWTPASGLHEIRVNEHPMGVFISRLGRTEGLVDTTPMMVFERSVTDRYSLIGYAWPDGDAMRTYTLRKFGKVSETVSKRASMPLFERPDTDIVLVAALAQ